MTSFWNPSAVVTVLLLCIAMTSSASLYVDEYDDETLDLLRDLLTSEDMQPPIYMDDNLDDDNTNDINLDAISSSYLDYPTNDATSSNDDDNNSDDNEYLAAVHHTSKKSKRIPLKFPTTRAPKKKSHGRFPTTGISKRRPSCVKKCMEKGLIHPVQCHSLC